MILSFIIFMEDGMADDAWKQSLDHLKQARSESMRGLDNLEEAAKALRLFMENNRTAAINPARQKHFEALVDRISTAQRELDEIEKLINDLEKAPQT
jgi:Mg2+ and Co2+ transporter CorA